MDSDQPVSFSPVQIAILALLMSTLVAIAVYFGVRRPVIDGAGDGGGTSPGDPERPPRPSGTPRHFSEDLIVPGFTQSGAEISDQDAHQGHSDEGV